MSSSARVRRSPASDAHGQPESELMTAVLRNWRSLAAAFVAFAAAVLLSLLYKEMRTEIVNLSDVGIEDLKEYLLRRPSILYCGGAEAAPPVFTDLQKLIGNEYDFAVLNCDRKLPSGKSIWEKYGLNKKMAPTIFGVAPWARPVQASYSNMKTAASLRVLFESKLAVKANLITSTADLVKACGWSGQRSSAGEGRLPPCIAVAKGSRFSEDDAGTLKRAMRTHTRARFVAFFAKDRRLSVEEAGSYNPSKLSAKYYALLNDSSSLTLTKATTEDSILEFISYALEVQANEYVKHSAPIALIKHTAERIKDFNSDMPKAPKRSRAQKQSGSGDGSPADAAASDGGGAAGTADSEADILASKERQHRREAEVRERMSQEERDYLFEEDDESAGVGGEGLDVADAEDSYDGEADEEDIEIIEL